MAVFTAVMTLFLYQTLTEQRTNLPWIVPLFALFLFGVYDQIKRDRRPHIVKWTKDDIKTVLALWLGMYLTIGLHTFTGMPQVMASALIGLIAYVLLKPYHKAAYCGSFAGMIGSAYLSVFSLIGLGILLPLVYLISQSFFNGLGGKLGTIAFVSGIFVIAIQPEYVWFQTTPLLEVSYVFVFLISYISIIVLWLLKNLFRLDSVFVSSAFSLLMAMVFIQVSNGLIWMMIVFASSFVIMTDHDQMDTMFMITIAPLILGALYISTFQVLPGIGGKAGLMALITVIATKAVQTTLKRVRPNAVTQEGST